MPENLLKDVRDAFGPNVHYNELDVCKHRIAEKEPSISKVKDAVDRVLRPSQSTDWHVIRFFQEMDDSVRRKFREFQNKPDPVQLRRGGECRPGNAGGIAWETYLADYIKILRMVKLQFSRIGGNKWDDCTEFYILREIFKAFRINLLDSRFPLYGYASDKTSTKVYYWHGTADAIGWYKDDKGKGRYVIVDWKVLDILEFWEKSPDAFGKYLHQCLIFARLLQLHMRLDYLPHILIVPISSTTGRDIHPALFSDYPKECREAIESFKWSVSLPAPILKVRKGRPFHRHLRRGRVDRNLPLVSFLDESATVGELLDSLGLPTLEIV